MTRQFECPQDGCEFMVRANDEDEVVDIVERHAQERHGMSMDESDIRSEMQSA